MNIKRLLISVALGFVALKAATFLYAAIDNPIIEVNTAKEMDQLLKHNKNVMVEFYDRTCPVCQAFASKGIFKKMAVAMPHIKFAMVSAQEAKPLHLEYKVVKYPTFIFFNKEKQIQFTRDGKKVDRFIGYLPGEVFIPKVTDIFAQAELAAKSPKQASEE